MIPDDKEVFTQETYDYDKAQVGDLVNAAVVMNAMNLLPPACMRMNCAQLGEPYSHREDPATGKWRATYATFRCLSGDWYEGIWEYRGHCFAGETTERGNDPIYC